MTVSVRNRSVICFYIVPITAIILLEENNLFGGMLSFTRDLIGQLKLFAHRDEFAGPSDFRTFSTT
jgi:hypothetical protein